MPHPPSFVSGDSIRFTVLFEVSGTATDPTTVTFRTRNPNKIVQSYVYLTDAEVVRVSTGSFRIDLQFDLPGMWYYRWEGTGVAPGASEDRVKIEKSQVIG